jgi:hypothetical protein
MIDCRIRGVEPIAERCRNTSGVSSDTLKIEARKGEGYNPPSCIKKGDGFWLKKNISFVWVNAQENAIITKLTKGKSSPLWFSWK